MGLFDFPSLGPYSERRVDSFRQGDLFVSTVRVPDADAPFETAVGHPDYNEGRLVIVEEYSDIDEAREGHKVWVALMTAEELPTKLTSVSTSRAAGLRDAVRGERWRIMERETLHVECCDDEI